MTRVTDDRKTLLAQRICAVCRDPDPIPPRAGVCVPGGVVHATRRCARLLEKHLYDYSRSPRGRFLGYRAAINRASAEERAIQDGVLPPPEGADPTHGLVHHTLGPRPWDTCALDRHVEVCSCDQTATVGVHYRWKAPIVLGPEGIQ